MTLVYLEGLFSDLCVYGRLGPCLDEWHYFDRANAAREVLLAWLAWTF